MVDGPVLTRRAALAVGAGALLAACAGSDGRPPATVSTTDPRTSSGAVPTLTTVSRARQGLAEEWVLRTDSLPGGLLRAMVLLPEGYDGGTRRYPVLYLYHGSDGTHRSWLDDSRLREIVSGRDLIVVMPEGGAQGWYVDWAAADPPTRWESVHVRALVPMMDATYRTHADARGRAVAGCSMGGFGAVHYAQAYPQLFAAVTAFSGAVSLRRPVDFAALDRRELQGKPANAIFGTQDADARVARVDPPAHAARLAALRVALYCGDAREQDDAEEAAIRGGNETFVQALRSASVTAPLTVLPGGHGWGTWDQALRQDLPGLLSALTPAR